MNIKNCNNLKQGQGVYITVDRLAIPTKNLKIATAQILEVFENGSFTAHWKSNYNLHGDFRSELMLFNSDFTQNTEDHESRNEWRESNGLIKTSF